MGSARRTVLVLVAAAVLAGCGSDAAEVGSGGTGSTAPPPVTVPGSAPDLTGTITDVRPFVPVTEDCVPADEVDPDGVTSSDDPPVCTPDDADVLGTVLVEEQPDEATEGRKISYTVTGDTVLAGLSGFDDLAVGQRVDTWTTGPCAESYPEQCGLLALRLVP